MASLIGDSRPTGQRNEHPDWSETVVVAILGSRGSRSSRSLAADSTGALKGRREQGLPLLLYWLLVVRCRDYTRIPRGALARP